MSEAEIRGVILGEMWRADPGGMAELSASVKRLTDQIHRRIQELQNPKPTLRTRIRQWIWEKTGI